MHPIRPTAYRWLREILASAPTSGPCYHGWIYSLRAMEEGYLPQATIEAMGEACRGLGWGFEAELRPVESPLEQPAWHVRVWPGANFALDPGGAQPKAGG